MQAVSANYRVYVIYRRRYLREMADGFKVVTTEVFQAWWSDLSIEQREGVMARVAVLETEGPPSGGQSCCSPSSLIASSSSAQTSRGRWGEWYRDAIPRADDLYQQHLRRLEREGGKG